MRNALRNMNFFSTHPHTHENQKIDEITKDFCEENNFYHHFFVLLKIN